MGTTIHNIEMKPGKGGQLVRSAGTSAQVLGREGKYVIVRLQSGEVRLILLLAVQQLVKLVTKNMNLLTSVKQVVLVG